MLGFFIKPQHRVFAFVVALGLAAAGILYGLNTGAFQENNREELKVKREAAAAIAQ